MRVLLDHNVPRQLRLKLRGHLVLTAAQRGWDLLSNGYLLRAAEVEGFEVFVTSDRDFLEHQNDVGRGIAIIFLTTNNWPSVNAAHQDILAAVEASAQGTFLIVKIELLARKIR